jgi:flagellar biosynthesis GTPase FlhF
MILRRIVGRSMAEALARVEREVGKDALIVETGFEDGLATVIARRSDTEPPRPRSEASSTSSSSRYKRCLSPRRRATESVRPE